MTYDPARHHRRSIRLRGYDYTRAGAYFLTICSRDRACVFADILDSSPRLTPVGEVIVACWDAIPDHFPMVDLDAMVTMPNHVHGILVLGAKDGAVDMNGDTACRVPTGAARMFHSNEKPVLERFGAPVSGSIPTIVRSFKGAVSKAINDDPGRDTACRVLLASRLGPLPPGRIPSIWQARYHEHVIRNERSLELLRTYIAANPARWSDDSLHPDKPFGPNLVRSRAERR